MGLAFLRFLAGLEIDFTGLRGRLLSLAALGWAISLALAVAVGLLRGFARPRAVVVGSQSGRH